jgi:hypothetical protein
MTAAAQGTRRAGTCMGYFPLGERKERSWHPVLPFTAHTPVFPGLVVSLLGSSTSLPGHLGVGRGRHQCVPNSSRLTRTARTTRTLRELWCRLRLSSCNHSRVKTEW